MEEQQPSLSASRPLLLRMATRQQQEAAPASRYDHEQDELLVEVDGGWAPAIDAAHGGPVTKKNDMEKGEDQKDRWR